LVKNPPTHKPFLQGGDWGYPHFATARVKGGLRIPRSLWSLTGPPWKLIILTLHAPLLNNLNVAINKPQEWNELTRLTQGRAMAIERVRLADNGAAIEGSFELPQLARLSAEDQVFVTAFVRSHGSIKEMERIFGVSYPTIKARLNRIGDSLDFVDTNPRPSRVEILERLRRGEITADGAIEELEGLK